MGRRIDEQTGLVRESQRPLATDSARRDASFEIFRSGRTSSEDKCSLCSRETSAPSEFSALRHTGLKGLTAENYESACTGDICSLQGLSEMVKPRQFEKAEPMERDDYLHDINTRIVRVTEDLRAIQRELNCAAMQAPTDPELMEALSQLPEMESLRVLKSALDQMRHFLWFYIQVMTNESEAGDRLRQSIRQKPAGDTMLGAEASLLEKFKCATDAALLRFLSDAKDRKPN